jgi:WD40 repeat protein
MNRHQKPVIRIFVSSPGDVGAERLAAERVLNRLRDQYASEAIIQPFFWEYEPLTATHHFQQRIPAPSSMDICICILWSRMGTPLPADEFKRPDGTPYSSGTEYEFEDAFASYRREGRPDLLVYRKTAKPQFVGSSADEAADFAQQLRSLEEFIDRWLHCEGGLPGKAYSTFDQTREFEDKLAVHVSTLIERRMYATGRREAVWKQGSPFRGLQAFDLEHAPIFFGREADTHRVIEQLRAQDEAHRAFVVVTGNSGSGKSSLIFAGVLPQLLGDRAAWPEVDHWRYAILRPTASKDARPIEALATALTSETALPELAAFDGLDQMIAGNPASTSTLVQGALKQAAQKRAGDTEGKSLPNVRLIVVVDQFEEVFSADRISDADRQAFFLALSALAQSGVALVLITLRSDFYDRFCAVPELASLKEGDGIYDLQPPTKAEIGQMIRRPAYAAGLRFEEIRDTGESLDDVLRDTAANNPDSLPLLEFCLELLYEQAQLAKSDLLTFDAYERIGRIEGSIRSRAQNAFDGVSADVREALPRVFRQLVHVSASEGVPSRRRARLAEMLLDPASKELVNAFIHARLLTAGEGTVEVVHEALFTHWQPLKTWLTEVKNLLQARSRVEEASARWEGGHMSKDLLLPSGALLLEAEQTLAAGLLGGSASRLVREFVSRSLAAHRWRRNVRRILVTSLVLLTIVATVLGTYAERQRKSARQSEVAAIEAKNDVEYQLALNLMERAMGAYAADKYGLGIALSHAAYERAASDEIRSNARDLMTAGDDRQPRLAVHANRVLSAALSPDGRQILTGNLDKTARLWDAMNGKELRRFKGHRGSVVSVAFSPDGQQILTGGRDETVRLWDATNGTELLRIEFELEGLDGVKSIVFSPNGRQVLAVSRDNKAKLWNSSTGKELHGFEGHQGAIMSVAFSLGGRYILSGGSDKSVRLWDSSTGKEMQRFEGHEGAVTSVAFSREGHILSGSSDKTAIWWDASTGKELQRIEGHQGAISSVAFSPDQISPGRNQILTRSVDNTIRLWSRSYGDEFRWFEGHQRAILSAAFSPDGRQILTVSIDNTIRLWDALSGKELRRFGGDQLPVLLAVFSPDGRQIVTVSFDNTISWWDASTGKELRRFELEEDRSIITSVAFSPDGRQILTAGSDNTPKLWHASSGKQLRRFERNQGSILSVAFSPDGRQNLTVSNDNNISLWDASTGKQLRRFKGNQGKILLAAFSPDGRQVLTVSNDNNISLWDASTGKESYRLKGYQGKVLSVTFFPDGRQILTSSADGTARLWDASSGKELRRFEGHGGLRPLAISPDGRLILTSSSDGTARLWDASSGKELRSFEGYRQVTSAAFSPDGRQLLTVNSDNTISVWDASSSIPVDSDLLAAWAVVRSGMKVDTNGLAANVTAEEWSKCRDILLKAGVTIGKTATDDQKRLWHLDCYAEATKSKQLFAAAFHMEQLVALNPRDAIFKAGLADVCMQLAHSDIYTRDDFESAIKHARRAVSVAETLDQTNEEFRNKTAASLGHLAWFELLNRDFTGALASANRAVNVRPNETWLKVRLAHALLFNGQFERAQALYTEIKNGKDGAKQAEKVLADFYEPRRHGITHPDMEKIVALMKSDETKDPSDKETPAVQKENP